MNHSKLTSLHAMTFLVCAFSFSSFLQLTIVILQFVYIDICIYSFYFYNFQPLSLEALVKCLALHSGGFRFPSKEKGVFLDRLQARSCNLEYLLPNYMTEFVTNVVHSLDTPSVIFTCSYK